MKPQFALSLSFEGIRLLQRAAGGWRRVGDVSVSAGDLAGALSALKDAAIRLGTPEFRTTLILPDDQIKYLSVPTGDVTDAARRIAAEQALNGATPYPVDALVFDISADGPTTHLAAVARETLAEAEAFANEHGFNPVCFVAAPDDQEFLGAPWFGQTATAATLLGPDDVLEPDQVRVVMVGEVEADTPQEVEADTPEAGALDVERVETKPAETEPAGDPAPETEAAAPKPQMDAATPVDGLADQSAQADTDVPAVGPVSFASRRKTDGPETTAGTPPELGAATRTPPTTPPTPSIAAPVADKPSATERATAAAFQLPNLRPNLSQAKAAFASRRTKTQTPKAAKPARPSEAERMTIFGARGTGVVGGKPKVLGLALTAALVLAMVGVAAFASIYAGERIAGMFQRERTLASTLPDDTESTLAEDVGATSHTDPQDDAGIAVAALNEGLTDGLSAEDAAVLDALRDPLPEPQPQQELDAAQLEARYAVTGIWPKAPDAMAPPGKVAIEGIYRTSIDPKTPALDAVALLGSGSLQTDVAVAGRVNPAAPGTAFPRDAEGRILATPEGTLSPEGFTVYAGRPPVIPPDTPTRFETDPRTAEPDLILAGMRPRARPDNLVEQNERAALGGLSRPELAAYRPRLRPQAPQELLATPEEPAAEPETEEAEAPDTEVATLPPAQPTLRPEARPRNFDRIVARTQRQQERGSTVGTATETASVAPRTVTPSIPSSASVAREATVRNAINLRRINLIGVYGTPSDRRALVRLSNGRYKKVQVGDRFDGGRVSAIGDSELRYQKGGRNVVLKMPSS